ncbi:alpha-D-ribose 1-methylphosphonate 5-triphosphate diphosphatase [Pseudooceanicola algae]|uniref:Alpha-D-ribose 1-methylphosphonate 5-triphosphate diphosphatase n=1 Tax=Pseudooceanicola algae TaxID=1537215 RepID=A0A418SC89_9RHOB|nr:alpha-D-ribose 1-methylphosphonate 5-triphosphate diphosphatase [Pseudooceanicola algae]QPM90027.1 Alpha-D-ribose 1-methylphosphonate 5-triphosphate diphosphatase [Pseudooceanicola algae]
MPATQPSLRLTGASILQDGQFQSGSLTFAAGQITDLACAGQATQIRDTSVPITPLFPPRQDTTVDLSGYLLLPGIIDLHGDAFERHVAPRPSAEFDLSIALRATDRDAAVNGVTTAWLAQCWSWDGGARSPETAVRMAEALRDYSARHALTDLRLQIRCETHMVPTEARLLETVRNFGIDYVVFNNHLQESHAELSCNTERLCIAARRAGRTPQDHLQSLRDARKQTREVPRFLCRLAREFDALGVTYGSHDDPDGETRETYSMIGAKICEFPTARAAAALARTVGDPILMGAPNVVRGGSQAGNISATELIRADLCDALVSDYYYPALAEAAFRLADTGTRTLAQAWALISSGPARVLGLHDRGTLAHGKRADLVILNEETRAIEATISGGRIAHLSGEVAHRFAFAPQRHALAAE